MVSENQSPHYAEHIVPLEQARYWEAYWADPTNLDVRNQIAEMNRGLVGWVLNRQVPKRALEKVEVREELEIEGFIGLLRAIELFDPTKGFTFSTYAPHWIRQGMTRHLGNTQHAIRVPIHVGEMEARFRKAETAFLVQEGHSPSDQEMATFLGLPEEAVIEFRTLCTPKRVVSTQSLLSSDGGELGDILADTSTPSALEQLIEDEAITTTELLEKYAPDVSAAQLASAINELPERTREMISLSAGDETLEKIGNRFGITRERVRQIIAKGIREIRKALGVSDELPVISIRRVATSSDEGGQEQTVHGITLGTLSDRLMQVVEEVKRYGRAKLRLPPSAKVRKIRQKTTSGPRTKSADRKKSELPSKPVKSLIVYVVTSQPPITERLEVADVRHVTKQTVRLQLTEQEYAVGSIIWRLLSNGDVRNLDFESIAKEVELPAGKVHLTTCALIAKGFIVQKGRGEYHRGHPYVCVKQKGLDPLELDLAVS